jgi:anti-sigma-K factor RskA
MSDDLERRLFALGDDAWDAPAPPPLDLDAVVAASGRPARARGIARLGALHVRAVTLRPAVALACAAALLGAGAAGGQLLDTDDDRGAPAPELVASVPLERFGAAPAGARATAQVVRRDGRAQLVVDASGLPASAPGEFYELWALRTPTRLVSLGTFRAGPDGRAHLEVPLPVDRASFPVLDVSVEAADGDPRHSARSLLRSAPA